MKKRVNFEKMLEIRQSLNKCMENKKWSFEYFKPIYRKIRDLTISQKDHISLLDFKTKKFERVYKK